MNMTDRPEGLSSSSAENFETSHFTSEIHMKKFKLNPDFVRRYAFVAILFAGMGGWFGYDGLVTYPSRSAAALYEAIEKSVPPPEMTPEKLEAFKAQKIKSQYGLSLALLVASAWVALILFKAMRFDFDPEKAGKILAVDRTRWEKKGILVLTTEKCGKVTLDAFHHLGVSDYATTLKDL